jgi:hypothetical protein
MLVVLILALVISINAIIPITGQFIIDTPATSTRCTNRNPDYDICPHNITLNTGDTYLMYLQIYVYSYGKFIINIPNARLNILSSSISVQGDWTRLMLYEFQATQPVQLSSNTPILTIKQYMNN